MRISRKEDYAVLLMSAIANSGNWKSETENSSDRPWISLDTIAKRYHLPLPFLQQIARDLKRAGLVKSREGVKGGYALMREPSKIALSEVLEATGGKLKLTQCTTNVACPIESNCLTRAPWQKLHQFVQQIFTSITLDQLHENTSKSSWQVTPVESSRAASRDPENERARSFGLAQDDTFGVT